jgi:hypothetical protein
VRKQLQVDIPWIFAISRDFDDCGLIRPVFIKPFLELTQGNVCRPLHQDKYKQSGFDCSAHVLKLAALASHFTLKTEYSKLIDDLISHLKTFLWHFYPTGQTVSTPYGVELLQ